MEPLDIGHIIRELRHADIRQIRYGYLAAYEYVEDIDTSGRQPGYRPQTLLMMIRPIFRHYAYVYIAAITLTRYRRRH